MLSKAQAYRLMPWAWSASWLLTGLGIWISDIYSSPSRSLVAYIALSAVGRVASGIVTASASRNESGIAVRLAAWAVACLVAILLGLAWMRSWNLGFLGLPVAIGVAGTIGGVASSSRSGAWRLLPGVLLGLAFLLFATVNFFASYLLMFFYEPNARLFGNIGANALIYLLPGALCGLGAGFIARRILCRSGWEITARERIT